MNNNINKTPRYRNLLPNNMLIARLDTESKIMIMKYQHRTLEFRAKKMGTTFIKAAD